MNYPGYRFGDFLGMKSLGTPLQRIPLEKVETITMPLVYEKPEPLTSVSQLPEATQQKLLENSGTTNTKPSLGVWLGAAVIGLFLISMTSNNKSIINEKDHE